MVESTWRAHCAIACSRAAVCVLPCHCCSYKGVWAANPRAPGAKGTSDRYIPDLVTGYPSSVKNYSTVPTAATAYRKILAAQPDHSVHIAAIGITTNMRDLVESTPDASSPLNGHDLIALKVSTMSETQVANKP